MLQVWWPQGGGATWERTGGDVGVAALLVALQDVVLQLRQVRGRRHARRLAHQPLQLLARVPAPHTRVPIPGGTVSHL